MRLYSTMLAKSPEALARSVPLSRFASHIGGGSATLADNVEREYAMQSLVENPEVFEDAITQNKIMIVRKGDESKRH